MMIMPKFPRFPNFQRFPTISPLGIRMRGLGKPAASGIEVDFSEFKELLDMLVDDRKSGRMDSETAPNKVEKEKPFMWSTSDLAYDHVEPDAHEDDVEGEKEEGKEQNSHMPKSILEMNLEKIFGPIVSNKAFKDALREHPTLPKKDPFVFIANRMSFLIQTMFPIVFDTSMIDTEVNSMTIAVNEDKTYPKLRTTDDLGFITSEINRTNAIQKEIGEFLGGTEFSNIYCFPSTIVDKRHNDLLMAVKFVIYPKRKHVNF